MSIRVTSLSCGQPLTRLREGTETPDRVSSPCLSFHVHQRLRSFGVGGVQRQLTNGVGELETHIPETCPSVKWAASAAPPSLGGQGADVGCRRHDPAPPLEELFGCVPDVKDIPKHEQYA